MDQASPQAREVSPLRATRIEEDNIEESVRRYIMHLARRHPFHLQVDSASLLINQELKAQWPLEAGSEQQARDLQMQINGLIKPLIESVHPWTHLRLIINASAHPEMTVPFPEAPAVYAAFDAAKGTIRHRVAGASEVPHDSWIDTIPLGLSLICQPIAAPGDPQAQGLGQGGNLFGYTDIELNEMEDWRRAHSKNGVLSMMPRPTEPFAHIDQHKSTSHPIPKAGAELAERALFRQRENQEMRQEDKLAEKAIGEREHAAVRAEKSRDRAGEEANLSRFDGAIAAAERNMGEVRAEQGLLPERYAVTEARSQAEQEAHLGGDGEEAAVALDRERALPEALTESGGTAEPLETTREAESVAERLPEQDVELTGKSELGERIAETLPENSTDIVPERLQGVENKLEEDASSSMSEAATEVTGEPPGAAVEQRQETFETAPSETIANTERAEQTQESQGEAVSAEGPVEEKFKEEMRDTVTRAEPAETESPSAEPEQAPRETASEVQHEPSAESEIESQGNRPEPESASSAARAEQAQEPQANAEPTEGPVEEKFKEEIRDTATRAEPAERESRSAENTSEPQETSRATETETARGSSAEGGIESSASPARAEQAQEPQANAEPTEGPVEEKFKEEVRDTATRAEPAETESRSAESEQTLRETPTEMHHGPSAESGIESRGKRPEPESSSSRAGAEQAREEEVNAEHAEGRVEEKFKGEIRERTHAAVEDLKRNAGHGGGLKAVRSRGVSRKTGPLPSSNIAAPVGPNKSPPATQKRAPRRRAAKVQAQSQVGGHPLAPMKKSPRTGPVPVRKSSLSQKLRAKAEAAIKTLRNQPVVKKPVATTPKAGQMQTRVQKEPLSTAPSRHKDQPSPSMRQPKHPRKAVAHGSEPGLEPNE